MFINTAPFNVRVFDNNQLESKELRGRSDYRFTLDIPENDGRYYVVAATAEACFVEAWVIEIVRNGNSEVATPIGYKRDGNYNSMNSMNKNIRNLFNEMTDKFGIELLNKWYETIELMLRRRFK